MLIGRGVQLKPITLMTISPSPDENTPYLEDVLAEDYVVKLRLWLRSMPRMEIIERIGI